jgi:hypothetical protein
VSVVSPSTLPSGSSRPRSTTSPSGSYPTLPPYVLHDANMLQYVCTFSLHCLLACFVVTFSFHVACLLLLLSLLLLLHDALAVASRCSCCRVQHAPSSMKLLPQDLKSPFMFLLLSSGFILQHPASALRLHRLHPAGILSVCVLKTLHYGGLVRRSLWLYRVTR